MICLWHVASKLDNRPTIHINNDILKLPLAKKSMVDKSNVQEKYNQFRKRAFKKLKWWKLLCEFLEFFNNWKVTKLINMPKHSVIHDIFSNF